jgi:hypothetical protein
MDAVLSQLITMLLNDDKVFNSMHYNEGKCTN